MNQRQAIDDPTIAAEWLSAGEAARVLGVKRETLYAYASRGKIATQPGEGRRQRYRRADVVRLVALRDARAGHGAVAAGALRWGEPVLDSAVTEIRPEGHRYRGQPALALAQTHSFEAVAELLWGGDGRRPWPAASLPLAPGRLASLLSHDARPVDAIAMGLPAMATWDPMRLHAGEDATLRVARLLIRRMIACAALPCGAELAKQSLREPGAARALVVALGAQPTPDAAAAVERALILCADHELNPSSFAARVAASAGSDVYACVGAALATLVGPHHGGMPERVEALLAEIGRPERAARVVAERLRRGDEVPGFGHTLYPRGDPRTAPLLEAARRLAPRSRVVRSVDALVDAMQLAGAPRPTLDVGLVALSGALQLGPGAPVTVFAIGRTAGWIAHVLEQRQAGFLLRPRARYVGVV